MSPCKAFDVVKAVTSHLTVVLQALQAGVMMTHYTLKRSICTISLTICLPTHMQETGRPHMRDSEASSKKGGRQGDQVILDTRGEEGRVKGWWLAGMYRVGELGGEGCQAREGGVGFGAKRDQVT